MHFFRQRLKKILDGILYSNAFIALCCVVMCWQSFFLFHQPIDRRFLLFVFFATLASYNFHSFFTPKDAPHFFKKNSGSKVEPVRLLLFLTGLAGVLWLGSQLSAFWGWLLATALATFLYSAPKIPYYPFVLLRKIAIGKTIFLALAWTHVTAILPVVIAGSKWTEGAQLFAINRFFFILPICILFDYRDRKQDRKEGLKSMVNELSFEGIAFMFWSTIFVYIATTLALFIYHFTTLQVLILLFPAVLLALLFKKAIRTSNQYLYYFVLDGLMMLSGLLFLFF